MYCKFLQIFLNQNELDQNLGCKFFTDLTAMHSETSHTTLLYILFKMRNFTRQHNFAVYCLKMSLTPQNISGKARHCEPSEFESHMIIMDSWLRADSNLIETHSDSFHLYDRSEVLWQTLSIKNLAVPHVKSRHKNKPCWVL